MTGARRGGLAVFVNPRSRANRRNPGLAREFAAVLGETGRVLAPASLDELNVTAAALRAAPPDVVAVHGGDGTLHKVVTALGAAFGDAPLPPIALLPGGTMNVVASSLHIGEKAIPFLRSLAEGVRAGRRPALVQRRCLRVGDHLGFIFGNGIAANFLGEYYADDAYGPRRALWLLTRTFLSAFVRGPFVRRIFRRFEGEVRVDGALLPLTRFVGVNAATVREVGLGFKLNHRADDDPERFGVLAIHAPPLALAFDLRAVFVGRGIAPSRAFSAVASTLDITPSGGSGEMSYTIDGDLYRTSAPTLRLSVGPRIQFVRPHAAENTQSPALLSAPAGDTMKVAR
ncbi:MAG TPA: diacylglycerol kinase family protein [Polyangia bacterium]|nr:diacylglycerol kinase family protein [Polyangia bacterium]